MQASQPHSAELCAAEQGVLAAAILYSSAIILADFYNEIDPF